MPTKKRRTALTLSETAREWLEFRADVENATKTGVMEGLVRDDKRRWTKDPERRKEWKAWKSSRETSE